MDESENWIDVLGRIFCAGILCFFAVLPLTFCFVSISAFLKGSLELDLQTIALFFGSAAASYFFLLLAFRAATGRGRKSDGGLMPPLAMKLFLALFSLTGIAMIGMGLWDREWLPVLGGSFYIAMSVQAWRDQPAKTLRSSLRLPP